MRRLVIQVVDFVRYEINCGASETVAGRTTSICCTLSSSPCSCPKSVAKRAIFPRDKNNALLGSRAFEDSRVADFSSVIYVTLLFPGEFEYFLAVRITWVGATQSRAHSLSRLSLDVRQISLVPVQVGAPFPSP